MKIVNYSLIIITLGLLVLNLKTCLEKEQLKVLIAQNHKIEDTQTKAIESEARGINNKINELGLKRVIQDATQEVFSNNENPFLVVAVSKGIIDTIELASDIQKNQIQGLILINTNLIEANTRAQKTLDSLKKAVFSYSDNYVKLKYGLIDTLGKKISPLNFRSNPRSYFNPARKLTVEQKVPQFGLRLQLRSIYSLTSQRLFVGPGLSFDYNRYNFMGYSYYNVTDNRWNSVIGVNYDLVRF